MSGKYEIKKSANGQFYFNLKAGNHEIILTSETYVEKHSAQAGIESVRHNAPLNERYERLRAANDQLYFVLKAANGEPIGRSEMYAGGEAAMENGIASVKHNAPDAPVKDLTGE